MTHDSTEKKLIIHVGTWKTGTTSIQQFLCDNREDLKEKGFLYPVSGCLEGYWGHHEIPRMLSALPETESKWAKFVPTFRDEVAQSGCNTVILSSEEFWPLWILEPLKSILPEFNISIVAYLRPQNELINALFYTELFSRKSLLDEADFYNDEAKSPLDYLSILNCWSSAFGKDNIIVKLYYHGFRARFDIISDFSATCGLPKFQYTRYNAHKTLPVKYVAAFKYFLREKLFSELEFYHLFTAVHKIAHFKGEEKSFYSPSFTRELLQSSRENNVLVRQKYFDGQNADLFYEPIDMRSDEEWSQVVPDEKIAAAQVIASLASEVLQPQGAAQGSPTGTDHPATSVSSKALQGKNGFLFLGGNDTNETVAFLSNQKTPLRSVEAVHRLNRIASERISIPLVYLVIPEAHVLYQEELPDGVCISTERPIFKFLEHMGPYAFYPEQELSYLVKKGLTAYTGRDSHWTTHAAFYVYDLVREHLGCSGLRPNVVSPVGFYEAEDLTIDDKSEVISREHRVRYPSHWSFSALFSNGFFNHGSCIIIRGKGLKGLCLVFGSSFSSRIIPAILCDFEFVVFIYNPAVDSLVVDIIKPDAIIVESPERFIHYPTLCTRGGSILATALGAFDPGYTGIKYDNLVDDGSGLSDFIKLQRSICRSSRHGKFSLDDENLNQEVSGVLEQISKLGSRLTSFSSVRLVLSGSSYRDYTMHDVHLKIDSGAFSVEDINLFPDSEMGLLSKIRLLVRAKRYGEAKVLTSTVVEMFGESIHSTYYTNFLSKQ